MNLKLLRIFYVFRIFLAFIDEFLKTGRLYKFRGTAIVSSEKIFRKGGDSNMHISGHRFHYMKHTFPRNWSS